MLSIATLHAGSGWRYYFRGVMVGDGHRPAGKPLRAAQEEADVPAGRWTGRGLAALGLVAGDVVTERQAELLLGEGRHPDADRIERERLAAGLSPEAAQRATVLGRPIEHIDSAVLALDLVFRAPPTAHVAWALGDDDTRRVLELCQQIARDKTLDWLEASVAQVRWGSGGRYRAPVRDGLTIAVFRHYEARSGQPLLHEHALISVKVRRPDGRWGNLSADCVFDNVVAAGTLYTLAFMEEVSERLGVAWEPREVTPGKRPVMEIAGIDHRLIGWQSTNAALRDCIVIRGLVAQPSALGGPSRPCRNRPAGRRRWAAAPSPGSRVLSRRRHVPQDRPAGGALRQSPGRPRLCGCR